MSFEQLPKVKGIDFNQDVTLDMLIQSMATMGGQASKLSEGIKILNKVLNLRQNADSDSEKPMLLIGFTSNMISSGVREILNYIAKHKLADAFVTTCGAIEEDIMKASYKTYIMDYLVNDKKWRTEGKNRIGNMVVPNDNYSAFDKMFEEMLLGMLEPKFKKGLALAPSEMIRLLGEKETNPESVWYWTARNNIPVFSPGAIDGAVGDELAYLSVKDKSYMMDVNEDTSRFFDFVGEKKRPLACLILGGGSVRYHIMTACKLAGGLDYGVFMTTGNQNDGSNSGAMPSQDVTRGAVKRGAETVLIDGECSFAFPMMAQQTFAKVGGSSD